MTSYYKQIDGVKYDRDLLTMAEGMIGGKSDGRLGVADARNLITSAKDGPGITDCEKRTLVYISTQFKCTPTATTLFKGTIDALESGVPSPLGPSKTPAKSPAPVKASPAAGAPAAARASRPISGYLAKDRALSPQSKGLSSLTASRLLHEPECGPLMTVSLLLLVVLLCLGTYVSACGAVQGESRACFLQWFD
eukprot:TRINITY_DN20140_c0_g1_i4.p1 TRINITY_DN20140_c0_g1~~TRINITY_DN20140_c0_g1_i4.p1  ORF type:complete len:194 (+),score=38.00 TRINITY_DN20140_c0_g1_i4:240-821(+)